MFDTPKAVHFKAWIKEGELSARDPVGLEYRWAAASAVARDVTDNMLRLSQEQVEAIRNRLNQANVGRIVRVSLVEDPSPFSSVGTQ